jgi:hypothetical protein
MKENTNAPANERPLEPQVMGRCTKINKVSLFYFFVLQLATEAIIKTTERAVPTIIAGNIWSADSLKNL